MADCDGYGIDNDGPTTLERSDEHSVTVPEIPSALLHEDIGALQVLVNPLAHSEFNGVELYLQARDFVENRLA